MFNLSIDKTWTLFLDRDGVINKRPLNDYVKTINDFVFIDGAKESLADISKMFGVVVIVTNQQGIGKGLMSKESLEEIHEYMLKEIAMAGGRIDKVYFCGDLSQSGSLYRKPGIGMGLMAKKDFPHIVFNKSVMVGDTLTDMIFGNRLHMITVLIDNKPYLAQKYPKLIHFRCKDLVHFARLL